MSKQKQILYFGIYNPSYARNRVIMRGLEANGCTVVECRVDPEEHKGIRRYRELFRRARKLDRSRFDYVIIGFPGHTVVWLARLLFGRRIIFDAFLSRYDSNVHDRRVHRPYSLAAAREWVLDWHACVLAHRILLDTNEHIRYFTGTFGIRKEKFIRVLVGASEMFTPVKARLPETFTIHFHGTFVPLQGVRYIVQALALLKNEGIVLKIVGDGGASYQETLEYIEANDVRNVSLSGRIPLEALPERIAHAHICLGIFGDTEKTKRVIPNKVYEYAAMEKPIITADTPAIREVFHDEKDIILCPPADHHALAEKILLLARDANLREKIGAAARATYQQKATAKRVAGDLLSAISVI